MRKALMISIFMIAATSIIISGCTDDFAVSPKPHDSEMLALDDVDVPQAALRFTGRDSFGIALKGRISGTSTLESDGRCPDVTTQLSGTGTATHMGRVTVEQSHCTDSSDPGSVTDGVFLIRGVNGTEIRGTYDGQIAAGRGGRQSFEAVLVVFDGTIPAADIAADADANRKGWAEAAGTMVPGQSFAYAFDGWLFHHERNQTPE